MLYNMFGYVGSARMCKIFLGYTRYYEILQEILGYAKMCRIFWDMLDIIVYSRIF